MIFNRLQFSKQPGFNQLKTNYKNSGSISDFSYLLIFEIFNIFKKYMENIDTINFFWA